MFSLGLKFCLWIVLNLCLNQLYLRCVFVCLFKLGEMSCCLLLISTTRGLKFCLWIVLNLCLNQLYLRSAGEYSNANPDENSDAMVMPLAKDPSF